MALIFEQITTRGIAQLSYLIGDDSAGKAAVIDPRSDVDVYLERAHSYGVEISHIVETHIHADFLSGALELRSRLPGAQVLVSGCADASYGFDAVALADGDEIELGSARLRACFTPGHSPEHLSFLAMEDDRSPWAIFSGDSLFVDSVGRPDLLDEDETEELAGKLYDSISGFYGELDSGVIVFPGHGAGSACGPDIGDRKCSTVGYERAHNPYLSIDGRDRFIRRVLETAPPAPRHYKRLKSLNADGPPVFGGLPPVPALSSSAFREKQAEGPVLVLDTRDILAFAGGHIPGAVNIAARPELSVWAGWLIEADVAVLLVLHDDTDLEKVTRLLWRVGLLNFAGYLAGGMDAWNRNGLPLARIGTQTVRQMHQDRARAQIVDVRSPAEWDKGHVPGAKHLFLPTLREGLDGLHSGDPVVMYCDSGFRASIAASLLKRAGFEDVRTVPGSWQAWEAANLPIEK